jgi:hypothetical protein
LWLNAVESWYLLAAFLNLVFIIKGGGEGMKTDREKVEEICSPLIKMGIVESSDEGVRLTDVGIKLKQLMQAAYVEDSKHDLEIKTTGTAILNEFFGEKICDLKKWRKKRK